MTRVIACVDGSAYTDGVCDHAAWFAGRIEGDLTVLNVHESGDAAEEEAVLARSVDRLFEEGAPARSLHAEGRFAQAVAALSPDLVVMGKRGAASESERRLLGSNVETVITSTPAPVCLTSRRFLPIQRVLVLLDADMSHRRAVEFIASHPGLRDLDTDLVVAAAPGEDADKKMEWARSELAAADAEVFSLEAEGLDEAVIRYRTLRPTDLVIVSRPVLFPELRRRHRHIDENGMWGFRTPVLVC